MKALGLFAGAGGWDVAARWLGIEAHGVENMPEAVATRDAAGLITVHDDVWTFAHEGWDGTYYDGLIASPPCQTFSQAGKGSGRKALGDVLAAIESQAWLDLDALRQVGIDVGDDRTALVLTPLHYAHLMRPEWIAWEQVPTVLPVWEACAPVLHGMGYSVWTGKVSSEQFGVAQTRERAVLIASRSGVVSAPVATHSRYHKRSPERIDPGMPRWVSMAEVMGWAADTTVTSNYGTGGDASKRGVRRGDQPAATVTSKTDRNIVRHPQAMGDVAQANGCVRDIDQPAPTITGAMDNGNHRWLKHNAGDRNRPRDPETGKTVVREGDRDWYLRFDTDRPAPTVTSQASAWAWEHHDAPEFVSQSGSEVDGLWPWKRPSTTVAGRDLVQNPGATANRFNGSTKSRNDGVRLTVAECGVLQSFPTDYPWQGTKSKQHLQAGNAVPPLLAKAVLSAAINTQTGDLSMDTLNDEPQTLPLDGLPTGTDLVPWPDASLVVEQPYSAVPMLADDWPTPDEGLDPVAAVAAAVDHLAAELDRLVDAADDPQGVGLALMLADVRQARERLYGIEADIERVTGKALMDDQVLLPGLRVERYRAKDRKEWRHDDWQRDVREKALRKHGLLHPTLLTEAGELVEVPGLHALLADVQAVHGAGAPKTTALRGLGLDASEYCTTVPGQTKVRVLRQADDTPVVEDGAA